MFFNNSRFCSSASRTLLQTKKRVGRVRRRCTEARIAAVLTEYAQLISEFRWQDRVVVIFRLSCFLFGSRFPKYFMACLHCAFRIALDRRRNTRCVGGWCFVVRAGACGPLAGHNGPRPASRSAGRARKRPHYSPEQRGPERNRPRAVFARGPGARAGTAPARAKRKERTKKGPARAVRACAKAAARAHSLCARHYTHADMPRDHARS